MDEPKKKVWFVQIPKEEKITMTPNELRAEAAGIDTEEGPDTTRECLLRAAADEIERLKAKMNNWRSRIGDVFRELKQEED